MLMNEIYLKLDEQFVLITPHNSSIDKHCFLVLLILGNSTF
jgi:hypothetical protein